MGHERTDLHTTLRAALGICATALLLLALAPSAQAGPPFHAREKALDVSGLNHACGAAVDSKGDLYAANEGKEVKVFNSSHTLLTSIANAKEPCGLAVDSKGNLYVSEQATGNVVRYKPNKYPFEGTPTYEGPTAVDASGKAKGISVDLFDDRLYVAEGTRVSTYDSEGALGNDEIQRVLPFGATGGTYKLIFEGQETEPIPYKASHAVVAEELEALSTIGAGNVSVGEGSPSQEGRDHIVTFTGALARTGVPQIKCDKSGLEGSSPICDATTTKNGFNGHIGEGELTEATGVASYTHENTHYLLVADGATDQAHTYNGPSVDALKHRRTIEGPKTGESFEFGEAGTAVVADPETGHFFLYDDGHRALDELEATGELVVGTTSAGFADAEPSAIAVDRSGGAADGTIYVGAGAGAAAKLLAFKSLSAPKREPLTGLSSKLTVAKARAVAVDRYGDVYVSAESKIYVYDPAGTKLVEIAEALKARDIDVDSEGNLYVRDGTTGKENLTYYEPSSFPPTAATTYERHEPALLKEKSGVLTIAVNPANDHVFAGRGSLGFSVPESNRIQEWGSAKEGSPYEGVFAPWFEVSNGVFTLGVYAATGSVYASGASNEPITVLDADGTEALTKIAVTGADCPAGKMGTPPQIGIDQANGHIGEFAPAQAGNAAREYEASGTCVAEFGVFSPGGETGFAIAADSACAIHRNGSGELEPLDETTTPTCKAFDPSNGNVYVASDGSNNTTQPYDVNAFGPLDYGTPPPLAKYKLTLEKKGSGSGKVTSDPPGIDCGSACAAEFEEETRVTLSAKAAAGSEFKAWSGCDAEPEPEPGEVRCEVALGEARKASAEFESTETEEFELAAAKEGPGAGTVTSSPAGIDCGSECSHDFLKNTEVTLSAKAGASSEFAGWGEGDCETETASPAEGTCTVTMTEAREVRAAFEAEHPVLSVEVKGPGTVTSSPAGIACPATCTAKFALHAKVTLTAKAGEAAEFKAWSGCDSKPSPSQCTVSMDEPRQVSATFTALPQAIAKPAQPVLYKEATLRGEVGTAGVKTEYRFEYLSEEAYAENGETFAGAQQTPTGVLAPSEGLVAVKAPLVGLKAGTVYRFRLQVENAIGAAADEAAFTTLQRQGAGACPNIEYRTGASAGLPDCRAYEMVTPADTGGHPIHVPGANFPEWPVAPRGEGAGNRVSFGGLFPGFEGNGNADTFVSRRGPGPHPAAGWVPELIGPDYEQVGGEKFANPDRGVSADQEYSLYQLGAAEGKKPFPNTPAEGSYLRVPGAANAACNSPATEIVQPHFELVGCGSLGGKTVVDPAAVPRFPSAGARHLIFTSDVRLDDAAPAAGTEAIYDREAGAASAEVLSTQPEGGPFAANVSYIAASEDGDAVVFAAAGALYLHRAGQTTEISAGPATFAGVSADGSRVFYADAASGGALPPAGLFACDTEAGSCIAGAQPGLTQIAADSTFVALAAGGANAYFTSEDALTGPEENEAGQSAEAGAYNLYAWDGAGTRLIAVLDPEDTAGFDFPPEEAGRQRLDSWVAAVNQGRPASVPARSTPGGEAFVFGSRARLSAYDTQGVGQVYRYAPAAAAGERLLCVSCAQTGTPPGPKEALLASLTAFPSVIGDSTLTYNVTDDGGRVFFQSPDRLVPEDANGAIDVYEWVARGEGECTRPGGCLALISSGQGEASSFLYGMTPDGHDVLFRTPEKLIGADIAGNPSLYDARIDGGIPEPPLVPVCHGDACQGEGSEPPPLTEPATGAPVGNGNVEEAPHRPARCPKGKRRVKGRCVKPHKHRLHKHRKHKRAMTDRRTER